MKFHFSYRRIVFPCLALLLMFAPAMVYDSVGKTRLKRKGEAVVVHKANKSKDTSMPAPLVDDSPINPDEAKADSSTKDSTDGKERKPKKRKK
ncbi:MAG: hypothetical protein GF344_08530 [Chitinivibrionales bacterium]|nr:hypothetical protein [Chitinivibrionales bacterium]MBD3356923.1 hypothetical protein [Chitinivibrionales bacterium]